MGIKNCFTIYFHPCQHFKMEIGVKIILIAGFLGFLHTTAAIKCTYCGAHGKGFNPPTNKGSCFNSTCPTHLVPEYKQGCVRVSHRKPEKKHFITHLRGCRLSAMPTYFGCKSMKELLELAPKAASVHWVEKIAGDEGIVCFCKGDFCNRGTWISLTTPVVLLSVLLHIVSFRRV